MKQLSKDYRLVSLATLIGSLLVLAFIHLPEWISNDYFWQIACYTLMVLVMLLIGNLYINAGRLATSFNKPSQKQQ